MTSLTSRQLIWLLPLFYFTHVLEEYFAGETFPVWFSRVFQADLSQGEFVLINMIGLVVVVVIALSFEVNAGSHFMLLAFSSLFFLNGLVHFGATIWTNSFSPGLITGMILFMPMSYLLFRRFSKYLTWTEITGSVLAGFVIHYIVYEVARAI